MIRTPSVAHRIEIAGNRQIGEVFLDVATVMVEGAVHLVTLFVYIVLIFSP